MFTTEGRTLCATMTIGVRRDALTVGGIGLTGSRRRSTVCDSATGLQAMLTKMRTSASRECFIALMLHLQGSVKLKLLYNPMAGRGRARHHIREVEQHLRHRGADVDTYASTGPADLTRAAGESSRAGFDRVVVCGGDGTLNLALREFDLSRGTLALVPLGSGDDFARVNGIPRTVPQACDVVIDGKIREVDVALANDLRYAGVAGLGFDSECARFARERVKLLRGSVVYLYAILRVLPNFRPRRVRIDGRDEEIMFVVFGNSPQYAGGIKITPPPH